MNPDAPPDVVRSNERLRALAEVSRAFAEAATDPAALVERIARSVADQVGDGCTVTLLDADGETLRSAAMAHRDLGIEADYRAYMAARGAGKTTSATVSAGVIRTGEPKVAAEIDPAAVAASTDEALRPIVTRLNVHSFAVVPIRARGGVIGALSLLRSGPGRGYTAEDSALLQDMADRAGLAIDAARVYDELERRVRERTADLEAVSKELEAFSYAVAHDLRAPLRAVSGFAQAAMEECSSALDAQGRDYLRRVVAGAARMGELIDALLALSRVTRAPIARETVDVSAVAASVVESLRAAEPARSVEAVIQPGMVALADPRLLRSLLDNLLGNAFKFTARRVDVKIEVGAEEAAGATVITVRDNGAGFDMAHAAKLFAPFQRLHAQRDFAGTGIGLATAARIVARHGGRIWAEGAVGAGAAFRFTLSARAPEAAA